MSPRKKRRPPTSGLNPPTFTILTRDDLDKLGAPCALCERRIDHQEAPSAGIIESTTSGKQAYVHARCVRRARLLGNERLK